MAATAASTEEGKMILHYCYGCGFYCQIDQTSKLCQPCITSWADAVEAKRVDGYDRNGVLSADGNVYSDADPCL